MSSLAFLYVPGAQSDGAGLAVEQALAKGGLHVTSGPSEPGEIIATQLSAGQPFPEAVTWALDASGLVVRLYTGAAFGLQAGFARVLSAALGGLVLAMEATRTREHYLLGSFIAGRTIELTTCDGGIVTGPGGCGVCDEDEVIARFINWSGIIDLRRLGLIGATGLLGIGKAAWPAEPTESPLTRIAIVTPELPDLPGWRCRTGPTGVVLFDRDGTFDLAPGITSGPAVCLNIAGCGREVQWRIIDEGGQLRSGTARDHAQLVTTVPRWALM